MKPSSPDQLILNFSKVERNFGKVIRCGDTRARDSDGRFASENWEDDNDKDLVGRLRLENEMINRKYLAVAKQLVSAERELYNLKHV